MNFHIIYIGIMFRKSFDEFLLYRDPTTMSVFEHLYVVGRIIPKWC